MIRARAMFCPLVERRKVIAVRAIFFSLAGIFVGIFLNPIASGDEAIDFFEEKIRPVLAEKCYSCHSIMAEKVEAGLLLDSRAGMLSGGESGPAVEIGKANSSLIMDAIRHQTLQMPPDQRLSDEIIQDFAKWIDQGMADPRIIDPSDTRPSGSASPSQGLAVDPIESQTHWAFQTLQRPPVPELPLTDASAEAIHNPIDAFVVARLQKQNWSAAAIADKPTLIRRATFDLTGLPPTPEEVTDFLNDAAPDAYSRVIDRLLASPRYGQRWGRHWLDLVRYADSNGADENHAMPVAWRYRDWVVDAFNIDRPYNDFLIEQLAGDLLVNDQCDEARVSELLVATGMLVIGPKMLAEQDKAKMRIDIVDEQIDTLSRTALGLTVACARCHDHKFDPISSKDYYALAGIFASTKTMENEDFVSQWLERPLPSQAIDAARIAYQPQIDAKRAERDALVAAARQQVIDANSGSVPTAEIDKHFTEEAKQRIAKADEELAAIEKGIPTHALTMAVDEAKPIDLPIHIRGNHLRTSESATPRGTIERLSQTVAMEPIPAESSGRLQLAHWLTNPQHPLTARVAVNRVWMWHFGQPLMRSPSNFGLRGERPTHQELLDWLAVEWCKEGYSMKWLHRLIMSSHTYQMTSSTDTYQDQDPDNHYLWRQNRRRLEIEPLRDAILAVGNGLDEQFNGPGVDIQTPRRTIYMTINRAALFDIFSTFDYVDPASHIEQRPVTTVPNQALMLMNHPLVHAQANQLAGHLLASEHDDSKRLSILWQIVYQREPTVSEYQHLIDYLDRVEKLVNSPNQTNDSRRAAWSSLIRTAIAASEFCYVE
jgi:hypothetical protein